MKSYRRSWRKPWWILGVIGASLLTMIKSITAFFQLGKIGGVLLTMLVSIWAYTLVAPLWLAVGVAFLLLVHELGHVIAAKQKGLPVKAPVFIPFIGALITLKQNPRNVETEAYIALGGPMLGTGGAVIVYFIGNQMGSSILVAIANVGFLFNLINLLPINPLDGGRIVGAVSRWLWLVGLIIGLFVVYQMSSYLLFVVWLFFAWDLLRKALTKQKKRETFLTWSDIDIPLESLTPAQQNVLKGFVLEELPFITYSNLSTSQQIVRFNWDEIGLKEFMKLPRQMLVKQVKLAKVTHKISDYTLKLSVRCKIICEVYDIEGYYNVSSKKRWQFGTLYALLIASLFYMLYVVNDVWVDH